MWAVTFGCHLQGHRVVIHGILHWQECEENRVALVGLRVSIVLCTPSKWRRTSRKIRNFVTYPCLCCSLYFYLHKFIFIALILLTFFVACKLSYSFLT